MIGLIPCAGQATRIFNLPKFLLPIPSGTLIEYICNQMLAAGAEHLVFGASEYTVKFLKEYIPPGSDIYIVNTATMSETLLAAPDYCKTESILFGMPDTFWPSDTVFSDISNHTDDDVATTLALFKTRTMQRRKLGMCDVTHYPRITRIDDKPLETTLEYAWGAMYWKPSFWQYIEPQMPHVGYAAQSAIEAGEFVTGVKMECEYWDCGTPDEYFSLCCTFANG